MEHSDMQYRVRLNTVNWNFLKLGDNYKTEQHGQNTVVIFEDKAEAIKTYNSLRAKFTHVMKNWID